MKLKTGVTIQGLHPAMRKVMHNAEQAWNKAGNEAVITAGTEAAYPDGRLIHSAGSFHPFGQALDFRTNYFNQMTITRLAEDMRHRLGTGYEVIIERDHIHIEYDPK